MKNVLYLIFILTLYTVPVQIHKTHIRSLSIAYAETDRAVELRSKIQDKNATISQLEKEIIEYQKQIDDTRAQSNTLQNTVKQLTATQNQLNTNIQVTENKIDAVTYTIEELGLEIRDKEERMGSSRDAIMSTLRKINQSESVSLEETILLYDHASELWQKIDTLITFQSKIKDHINTLGTVKEELGSKRNEQEASRAELETLKSKLVDQKKIVEINRKSQNQLLSETKNKESNYQKILKEKTALRDAFQKELTAYESELRYEIDQSRLPAIGKGVLQWPLRSIRITQEFGDTAFSRSRPGLYSGAGHNGVDFAAPVGTPLLAAASGTVLGTGDTDTVCPNASYGKWILIKHNNGLTTLYAHLSLIKASQGQSVDAGTVIGYSGNTGYSTGPHLHFTVYASDGVRITSRKSSVCSGSYTIPVADLRAYLNPLLYL